MRPRRGVIVLAVLALFVGTTYVAAVESVEDASSAAEQEHETRIGTVETERVATAYAETLRHGGAHSVPYGPLGLDHPRDDYPGRLYGSAAQRVAVTVDGELLLETEAQGLRHELDYPYQNRHVRRVLAAPISWRARGPLTTPTATSSAGQVDDARQFVIDDNTVYVPRTDGAPGRVEHVESARVTTRSVNRGGGLVEAGSGVTLTITTTAPLPESAIRAAFANQRVSAGGHVTGVTVEQTGEGRRITVTLEPGTYRVTRVTYRLAIQPAV